MLDLIINGGDRNNSSLTDALIASPSFSNNVPNTDLQIDVDDLELEDRRSRSSHSATRQNGSQQIQDDLNDLVGDDPTPIVRKTTTTTTTLSSAIKTPPPKQKQGTKEALSRSSNVGEMIKRRYEEKRAIEPDTDDDNTELDDDSLYLSGDDDEDDDSQAPLVGSNGDQSSKKEASNNGSSSVQIRKPARKANDGWFSYKGWQENKPVTHLTSPKKRSKTPTPKQKPTTPATPPAPTHRNHLPQPRHKSNRPGGPGGPKSKSTTNPAETSPPVRCGKKEILISLMTLYMVVSLYTNASRLFGKLSSKSKKAQKRQQPNHENYQDSSWNNDPGPDMMMSPQHQQLQPPMRDMYPMIHHQNGPGDNREMMPPPHHHQQGPQQQQHPGFPHEGMPHPPDQFVPPVGNQPIPQEFFEPQGMQGQMGPPMPDRDLPPMQDEGEEQLVEPEDEGEIMQVEEVDEEEPEAAEVEEEEPAVEEEEPAVKEEKPVVEEEEEEDESGAEAEAPEVKNVKDDEKTFEAEPVPEPEQETKPKPAPKNEETKDEPIKDKPPPEKKEAPQKSKKQSAPNKKDENPVLAVLADVDDLFDDSTKDAMPFFWSVPPNEAGTAAVKTIMDRCFDLTRSEVVSNEGNHIVEHVSSRISGNKAQKRRLLQLQDESNHSDKEMQQDKNNEQRHLYNLKMKNKMIRRRRLQEQSNDDDNKTDSQIEQRRLKKNQPANENKKDDSTPQSSQIEEDLLVASNLYILKKIFSPTHPILKHREAKMFTFFLHPNHRFAYMFEYLKKAKFEPTYDGRLATMSLMDYAKFLDANPKDANVVRVSNWMTRSLTHSAPKAELSESDVELATVILKEKSVVLLYDMMEESMRRLKSVFKWGADGSSDDCVAAAVEKPVIDETIVEKNKELWKYISRFNELDIQLYKNARVIFQEQGIEFFGKSLHDLVK